MALTNQEVLKLPSKALKKRALTLLKDRSLRVKGFSAVKILTKEDAGSVALARCTFVNTNDLTHLMPRNSAVESVIKSLAL